MVAFLLTVAFALLGVPSTTFAGVQDAPFPTFSDGKASQLALLIPTATDLRAISRLTYLGPYPLRSRGNDRLHATYLDTASLTLARNGVALRLRRLGRQCEMTVLGVGCGDDPTHERPELTIALPKRPVQPLSLAIPPHSLLLSIQTLSIPAP